MAGEDYYRVLGLKADASAKEIKDVYRQLAVKYHPDLNGGDAASEERLKEINQAYHVLGNEERRRCYDLLSRGPFENTMFHRNGLDDDLVNLLWRFSRMGAGAGWAGGCRGRGFGKGGCGRWKR
ncbi:MAG: DnaJ domain-containing protein [Candidatus Desulfacyla sp.]